MVTNTQVSSEEIKEMEKEFKNFQMETYLMVIGKIMNLSENAKLLTLMALFLKEVSNTIKNEVKENLYIKMGQSLKVNLMMIYLKVKVLFNTPMEMFMKVNFIKEKNKEKENTLIRMGITIKDNGRRVKNTVWGFFTIKIIKKNTKEIMLMMRSMDKVSIFMQMEMFIKEILQMELKKDKEH